MALLKSWKGFSVLHSLKLVLESKRLENKNWKNKERTVVAIKLYGGPQVPAVVIVFTLYWIKLVLTYINIYSINFNFNALIVRRTRATNLY